MFQFKKVKKFGVEGLPPRVTPTLSTPVGSVTRL